MQTPEWVLKIIVTYEWRCMQMSLAGVQLLVLLRWQHHMRQGSVLIHIGRHLHRHRHRRRLPVVGDHLNGRWTYKDSTKESKGLVHNQTGLQGCAVR